MRINFVMSNDVSSGIFDAIIKYFKQYLPDDCELFVTKYPLENIDVYHYHRPNLESTILENSVVTVHHDLDDTDPWFDSGVFIGKYHQADSIICLNTSQKNKLLKDEGLKNTTVIPHGVNTDLFSQSNRHFNNNQKLIVGVVSKRYGRRVKGEAFMLELYKRLDTDKIKFYFAGEGRTKDQLEAESFGFEAESYEYLPYSLFDQLYSKIDVLLVASLFEGGPANIPEALYTKTPILGRNIAMVSDVIVEGENGYFLTGDPSVDADKLNSLANDTNNIFTTLLKKINEATPSVLNWEEVVHNHVKVYRNIVHRQELA